MNQLTVSSIKKNFPSAGERRYAKNQIVCYQGDKPHQVFFVAKGHIKYYDINDNGSEKILHIIGPNNIFPMLYAYEISQDITGFYACIDDAEIITVPLEDFRNLMSTNVAFANQLTRWFLTEIEQLVQRINSFERTDSKSKILHAISYLALNFGHQSGKWQRLNFAATQQFIGDFTGITRETVSTIINELEREGVVLCSKGRLVGIDKSTLSTS